MASQIHFQLLFLRYDKYFLLKLLISKLQKLNWKHKYLWKIEENLRQTHTTCVI